MAAPRGGASAPVTTVLTPAAPAPERNGVLAAPPPAPLAPPRSLAAYLFEEGYAFEFFQAVRVLEKWTPQRRPVGLEGPPANEVARFRAHLSLSFPPSPIYEVAAPTLQRPPAVTVAFLGLTGPSGALPPHYTELLLQLERGEKSPEQRALREWLDLFNHRLVSLFYRAWTKYRFPLAYERGWTDPAEPDPFTHGVFSLLGLGTRGLRQRLRVALPVPAAADEEEAAPKARVLAAVTDLSLMFYGGLLAHRPRCAVGLEALLADYFQLPVRIEQFRGQWLALDADNQSALGEAGHNNCLGSTVVAGERVWDVQGKIRVQLGPLRLRQFMEFLPDRAAQAERKAFFLLAHLVRLYVGPELAFGVQLLLAAADVPACQLVDDGGIGPRLGWNTWALSQPAAADAADAAFEGEELFALQDACA